MCSRQFAPFWRDSCTTAERGRRMVILLNPLPVTDDDHFLSAKIRWGGIRDRSLATFLDAGGRKIAE